jgi:hypothetical protein
LLFLSSEGNAIVEDKYGSSHARMHSKNERTKPNEPKKKMKDSHNSKEGSPWKDREDEEDEIKSGR